jgi:hypothetical protein
MNEKKIIDLEYFFLAVLLVARMIKTVYIYLNIIHQL